MKKYLFSTVMVLFSITMFAQSTEKSIKQYGFWDNWFIQLQGGVNENFSENHKHASVFSVMSPAAAVSVGKYFSPEVGMRIQFHGWQAKNSLRPATDDTYSIHFLGTSFDALFNFTNIFCPYRENRVFNLIGITGVGYVRGFRNSDYDIKATNNVCPRVGFAADFRLSDLWNFNVEANGNIDADDFNGNVIARKYDGRLNVLVGFTYKFKNRGFKSLDVVDPVVYKSLNDKINEQRQQIEDLQNQLKNKPTPVVTPPVVTNSAPEHKDLMTAIVLFKIGQSVIQENQKANLNNLVKFVKENNTKVTVVGYADKGTGSAICNQKISEKRAASVAKALQDMGVDASKITVDAKGDTVQPFAQKNNWNRVVVISQDE